MENLEPLMLLTRRLSYQKAVKSGPESCPLVAAKEYPNGSGRQKGKRFVRCHADDGSDADCKRYADRSLGVKREED